MRLDGSLTGFEKELKEICEKEKINASGLL